MQLTTDAIAAINTDHDSLVWTRLERDPNYTNRVMICEDVDNGLYTLLFYAGGSPAHLQEWAHTPDEMLALVARHGLAEEDWTPENGTA
jgi:hypothetical protein